MLGLAARLRRPRPILVDQIFGTRDARAIEEAVDALPLDAVRCFRLEVSVGALFGLELSDGSQIALKVHQPELGMPELEAQQAVQGHLAARGFPVRARFSGPRRSSIGSPPPRSGEPRDVAMPTSRPLGGARWRRRSST